MKPRKKRPNKQEREWAKRQEQAEHNRACDDLLKVAARIKIKAVTVDGGDGTHVMLCRFDAKTHWRTANDCVMAAMRKEAAKNAKESLS